MVGLYFGGQWFETIFGNAYGNIELDANLEENHEWSAEITSNPVETGAPISDHIIDQQDKLKIKGFVTDAPLIASQTIAQISKSQNIFDILYKLIKIKEPITVYTQYKIYNDMVISNIIIPRTPGIGEAIEFEAEFIHIRKVSTQIVEIPAGISPKKEKKATAAIGKKTEPKKEIGKKQPETITKLESNLSRILK